MDESYLQKFIMTFDYTHLQSSYLATWLSYLFCIAYSQEKWHVPCEHWSKNLGKSSLEQKKKFIY